MKNIMLINGHQAVISYDPDIGMFRGEFLDLNGGADFYAADVAGLQREGQLSLSVYLQECTRRGIEPRKNFSGKFLLRVAPEIHETAAIAAAACGESLNQWVSDAIMKQARDAAGLSHAK
ncbi:MAG TPA: type II toxin-antitoxin system HicB family antitoxin [Eoetvoesiella sp.]|jgi:predicted HicB family RNase H-like nuclease|uniref:type II toxin-antitoxin system HicB family antitoxin n=1 Tax=Eoetvoesiella sp. TaxID=1966355 RepID=UPI002C85B12B|nr:type II toxin-antitoxin system HicB family antitoxin [Eoetvoesiella sp.]HWK62595.1 type II toxin-antitoxin system HicB family antitoxin [Eoetvoesiella sp.]